MQILVAHAFETNSDRAVKWESTWSEAFWFPSLLVFSFDKTRNRNHHPNSQFKSPVQFLHYETSIRPQAFVSCLAQPSQPYMIDVDSKTRIDMCFDHYIAGILNWSKHNLVSFLVFDGSWQSFSSKHEQTLFVLSIIRCNSFRSFSTPTTLPFPWLRRQEILAIIGPIANLCILSIKLSCSWGGSGLGNVSLSLCLTFASFPCP